MILVSSPDKPFEYTLKGTARRHAVTKAYEPEINNLYEAVATSAQSDAPLPHIWSDESVLSFVRSAVASVVQKALGDDDDLFQQGCDRSVVLVPKWAFVTDFWGSLQATYIRNIVVNALRESEAKSYVHGIPNNIVYTHPTIASLAAFVIDFLQEPSDTTETGAAERKIRALNSLVEKYGSSFPQRAIDGHSPPSDSSPMDVFLLTGSTGRLGAHVLEQLLRSEHTTKVYALNRGGAAYPKERHVAAFAKWELDTSLLDDGRVTFLTMDRTEGKLGLSDELYEEVGPYLQYH